LFLNVGLDEARRFHNAQATLPPLVIEFHYKMIELELAEKSPCIELIRQVMDKAAAQFGQQNPGTVILFFYSTYLFWSD